MLSSCNDSPPCDGLVAELQLKQRLRFELMEMLIGQRHGF